ncbi:hypothetical protein [Maricaulis sp.]|uniref:hypothetical protein n=1 Tax=Maricaulis sp. TaxID=1486257 RepID=UPI002612B169|nr:hypothetical protein [Maricaulis sp.]
MMRLDVFRALAALAGTLTGAVALTAFAPELRSAGLLPAPADRPELVYTLINVTEELAARRACPLDLEAAKVRVETGLGPGVRPVYSPIADGPDILVHEMTARHENDICRWTAVVHLGGRQSGPHADDPAASLSSLERASRRARPLVETTGR